MGVTLVLLVVLPLVGLATAAVWVPRPWQVLALLGGPVLTALGLLGTPGVERLGWVVVIGIPYAYSVVLPVLPWRRPWAQTVIPVTVLALAAFFVGLSGFDVAVVVYAALPVLAALVGLGLAARRRREGRRAASTNTPAGGDADD